VSDRVASGFDKLVIWNRPEGLAFKDRRRGGGRGRRRRRRRRKHRRSNMV